MFVSPRNCLWIGLLAATTAIASASAQVQTIQRPVPQTGPLKPVPPVLKPLTAAQLAGLQKPAPKFLAPAQLKARLPASFVPDLKTAFELTPAVQQVPGRGRMVIEGQLLIPKPVPPGFPGQAVIRRGKVMGTNKDHGGVTLTFTAQRNQFYAIECLVMTNGTGTNYRIEGTGNVQAGKMTETNGHSVFNVRKTDTTGDVTLIMHPDPLVQASIVQGQSFDINVMNFWGCRISTG